jgi:hypothetical protein
VSPSAVVSVRPVGPPQNGTVGLTLAASAGASRISEMSLYSQVSASVSPSACIVAHDE